MTFRNLRGVRVASAHTATSIGQGSAFQVPLCTTKSKGMPQKEGMNGKLVGLFLPRNRDLRFRDAWLFSCSSFLRGPRH
jgi:hypothetical protein